MRGVFTFRKRGGGDDRAAEKKELEPEPEEVEDIFHATLSAALGLMFFEGCPDARRSEVDRHVPALLPFMGSLIVGALQLLMLAGVGLEIEPKPYWDSRQGKKGNPDLSMITTMSLLAIVQATILWELYWVAKGCWFVVWSCLNSAKFRTRGMILAFLALFISGWIAYMTSKVSISVVLSESSLTQKIFNSLALSFVLDLDNQLYNILKEAFSVKATLPLRNDFAGSRKAGWSRRCGLLTLALVSTHQATNLIYSVYSGWLPITLWMCEAISPLSRRPSFLDGDGPGAKDLRKIWDFCDEHKKEERSNWSQCEDAFTQHPIAMSCWFLFIALNMLAVYVKDNCWAPPVDDQMDESDAEQTDAENGSLCSEVC